jgi:hypothetical protein
MSHAQVYHRRPRPALFLLAILTTLAAGTLAAEPEALKIVQHVDLVHFSHTDYGFTDHPAVCRELQRRFLDIAVDGALATRQKPETERLYWTAETTVAVLDWWQAATPARREEFLQAVRSGQLEVTALPLNNTPFLNHEQWRQMLHWLPEDLWQQLRPQVAVQNDVNGFPRAGALELLDRGIHRLFSGINEDSGGAPFSRPAAFWWKMPDGRRLFVYLNYSYPMGYWFFEPIEWRHGPVPVAGDTRYRPPRAGDFLRSDEASVRTAHRHLLNRVRALEAGDYRYPRLLLSITNQWRIDNDPPFLPLADFIGTWNRLGLKPTLRMTTASVGMQQLEEAIGSQVPEHSGEWTDWWANGTASAPREVAASRFAKRLLAAAQSPLWGELDPPGQRTVQELLQDLCLFDEHTWGSSNSVALPYSLDTQGQWNEKAGLAFRPMARAEWLLAQRVRSKLAAQEGGLYVANPTPVPWSGWISMPATALRDNYQSLVDPRSGEKLPLVFTHGFRPFTPPGSPEELTPQNTAATFPDHAPRQVVRFWLEHIKGESVRHLRLSTEAAQPPKPTGGAPAVTVDAAGWPMKIVWPGMARPLFLPGCGDFSAVQVEGFAPRWRAREVWMAANEAQRAELRQKHLRETPATTDERTVVEDNPHTTIYSQVIRHPRLQWAVRQLEVWKCEPRARYTLRLNRTSSEAPEAMFVHFRMACEDARPQATCGGRPFEPFHDQLPGTCRDYFGIDGWVQYTTPQGQWLWVSRDAPLVSFGGAQVLQHLTDPPKDLYHVAAMVFNNFWYTNFVGDSHGVMEFQFDLRWTPQPLSPDDVARHVESLWLEPPVVINPALREDPIVLDRLYRP